MPLAQSYQQARIQVEGLVERFDRNLDLTGFMSAKEHATGQTAPLTKCLHLATRKTCQVCVRGL